jgi:hypothetical protein
MSEYTHSNSRVTRGGMSRSSRRRRQRYNKTTSQVVTEPEGQLVATHADEPDEVPVSNPSTGTNQGITRTRRFLSGANVAQYASWHFHLEEFTIAVSVDGTIRALVRKPGWRYKAAIWNQGEITLCPPDHRLEEAAAKCALIMMAEATTHQSTPQ